ACIPLCEPSESHTWKTLELRRVARLAYREHHPNRLGHKTPSDEAHRPRRRSVQPLRIVEHTHERPFLRSLGQQTEDGQPDDEEVGRRLRAEPERRLERVTLWVGQSLSEVEHRCA